MALPLLLAAGATMLGGTRYLMGRQSDKQAQSMIQDLQGDIQNSPNPLVANDYARRLNNAQNQMANEGAFGNILNPFGSQSMIQGMMDNFSQDESAATQRQIGNQIASGAAARDFAYKVENDIQADVKGNFERYGAVQSTARRLIPGLENGSLSGLQAYEAGLGMLQTLLPGEAIMDGDLRAAVSAGGATAELASLLQRFTGSDSDPNWKRDVAGIIRRMEAETYKRYQASDQYARERIGRTPGANYDSATGGYGITPWRPGEDPYQGVPRQAAGISAPVDPAAAETARLQARIAELEQQALIRGKPVPTFRDITD